MYRSYSNLKIYENFKMVKVFSLIAYFISLSIILTTALILYKYPNLEVDMYYVMLYYIILFLSPLGQFLTAKRALKYIPNTFLSDDNKPQKPLENKESKYNNDFLSTLLVVISSFVAGVNIFGLVANIYLIHNCVLIKREWKVNPPDFVTEENIEKEQKRIEIEQKNAEQVNNQNMKHYKSLIEQCGIKFFIKYYNQIKCLPLRDVSVTENYTPTEREERLTAAKKIINLNLSEFTLNEIINTYSNILDDAEIERAKSLLIEIRENID